jgi:hypothetical protein
LTFNLRVVFKVSGTRNIYLRALDTAGADTGLVQKGALTLVAEPLGGMYVSPSSDTISVGGLDWFTLTNVDPPGFPGSYWGGWEQFLIATSPTGGGTPFCLLHFDRAAEALWMYSSDTGYFLGPVTLGTPSNLLDSSACSVDPTFASVNSNGGLQVPIRFKTPMRGNYKLFGRMLDTLNRDTGFVQAGTLTIQ